MYNIKGQHLFASIMLSASLAVSGAILATAAEKPAKSAVDAPLPLMAVAQPKPNLGSNAMVSPPEKPNFEAQPSEEKHDAAQSFGQRPHGSAQATNVTYKFAVGDKVKFNFYDRDDLSGTYQVRHDGRVSLPFVGTFTVADKNAQQLENEISAALTRLTKRATFLSVEAVERQPFYVYGTVQRSGAYPFVPNMMVLHALSIAGGAQTAVIGQGQGLQFAREVWRRNEASTGLKRALAKLSRLEAERNSFDKIVPSERLIALVGMSEALHLIRTEERLFQQRQRIFGQRRTDLQRVVELAGKELSAFKSQLKHVREQEVQHQLEYKDIQSLAKRGLTRRPRVYAKRYDIAQLRGTASEVQASIARASQALTRAKRDLAMLPLELNEKLEEQIQATNDRVANFEAEIANASMLLGSGPVNVSSTGQAGTPGMTFQIVRSNGNGYQTIEANSYTRILPGDVLQVSMGGNSQDQRIQEANGSRSADPAKPQAINFELKADQSAAPAVTRKSVAEDQTISKLRDVITALTERNSKLSEQLDTISKRLQSLEDKATDKRVEIQPKAKEADTFRESRVDVEEKPVGSIATRLQAELKRVGCYTASVDGIWGRKSRAAVRAFRKGMRLSLKVRVPTNAALNAAQQQNTRVCGRRVAAR